jgi:FkbM family methyltransferase
VRFDDRRGTEGDDRDPYRVGGIYNGYGNRLAKVMVTQPCARDGDEEKAMINAIKSSLKKHFPKRALQFKVRKLTGHKLDRDLHALANVRELFSASPHTKHLLRYFSASAGAIDVGACFGEYSYVLAKHFARVLCLEPVPERAQLLRKVLPSNCEVVECAAGSINDQVCLRIPKLGDRRMCALATVADHNFEFTEIDAIDRVMVKQTTLATLVTEREFTPSFIKIDVEGYEMDVLRGCADVIEMQKPILMVEIEKRHNKAYQDIFSFLTFRGYVPHHLSNGALCESDLRVAAEAYEVLASHSRPQSNYVFNYWFLPSP